VATNAGVRTRLEPSGTEVELASGERLLDALDEQGTHAALPAACRAGNCGACVVRVITGAEWLEPPAGHEQATLSQLGCGADMRLGCQIRSAIHARGAPDPSADPRRVILEIDRSPV
jgi:ferredoxin